jgi:hypothetical protein
MWAKVGLRRTHNKIHMMVVETYEVHSPLRIDNGAISKALEELT